MSGGQNQNGSIDATEEWIEKENKWKITTSFKLTDKRSGSAVAAVTYLLHLFANIFVISTKMNKNYFTPTCSQSSDFFCPQAASYCQTSPCKQKSINLWLKIPKVSKF